MSKSEKIRARRRAQNPYPDLSEILNPRSLDQHLARATVKVETHERLPLYLYNYNLLCEKRRAWDAASVTARGLVRDNRGRVIARPFQKFFSWGGRSASAVRSVSFREPWFATEKLDGTMVVASNFDGELVLCTRGSFTDWRLEKVRALWPGEAMPEAGRTWVLEYVGPENRIVLEYETERLVLLGAIDNWSGADVFCEAQDLCEAGLFSAPERFEADGPQELLGAGPDDGTREGYVVVWPRRDKPSGRLKVKYRGYLEAHAEILRGTAPLNRGGVR